MPPHSPTWSPAHDRRREGARTRSCRQAFGSPMVFATDALSAEGPPIPPEHPKHDTANTSKGLGGVRGVDSPAVNPHLSTVAFPADCSTPARSQTGSAARFAFAASDENAVSSPQCVEGGKSGFQLSGNLNFFSDKSDRQGDLTPWMPQGPGGNKFATEFTPVSVLQDSGPSLFSPMELRFAEAGSPPPTPAPIVQETQQEEEEEQQQQQQQQQEDLEASDPGFGAQSGGPHVDGADSPLKPSSLPAVAETSSSHPAGPCSPAPTLSPSLALPPSLLLSPSTTLSPSITPSHSPSPGKSHMLLHLSGRPTDQPPAPLRRAARHRHTPAGSAPAGASPLCRRSALKPGYTFGASPSFRRPGGEEEGSCEPLPLVLPPPGADHSALFGAPGEEGFVPLPIPSDSPTISPRAPRGRRTGTAAPQGGGGGMSRGLGGSESGMEGEGAEGEGAVARGEREEGAGRGIATRFFSMCSLDSMDMEEIVEEGEDGLCDAAGRPYGCVREEEALPEILVKEKQRGTPRRGTRGAAQRSPRVFGLRGASPKHSFCVDRSRSDSPRDNPLSGQFGQVSGRCPWTTGGPLRQGSGSFRELASPIEGRTLWRTSSGSSSIGEGAVAGGAASEQISKRSSREEGPLLAGSREEIPRANSSRGEVPTGAGLPSEAIGPDVVPGRTGFARETGRGRAGWMSRKKPPPRPLQISDPPATLTGVYCSSFGSELEEGGDWEGEIDGDGLLWDSVPDTPMTPHDSFSSLPPVLQCPGSPKGARVRELRRENSLLETKVLMSSQLRRSHSTFSFDNHFEFTRELGRGSFSVVYEARSLQATTPSSSLFAVKVSLQPFRYAADRTRWIREMEAVLRLGSVHPHVVAYHRAWQQRRHMYIQMDLCEGGSLRDAMDAQAAEGMADARGVEEEKEKTQEEEEEEEEEARVGPTERRQSRGEGASEPQEQEERVLRMRECQIWECARQVASGLAHIHEHGVVHLDIKPDNIFLDANGILKIGDFGHAMLTSPQSDWEEGDGFYMAPELLSSPSPPGPPADMYSFGAMMFEWVTGRRLPRSGPERSGQFEIPAGQPGRSPTLCGLLRALLRTNPSERPTAQQVLQWADEKATGG